MAAQFLGVSTINNVSGLGTAFIHQNWITSVVKRLYKIAFRRSATVFFQNFDDQKLFLDGGLVRQHQARVIQGSGIDLARFRPASRTANPFPVFLMVARLLWDKGVGEYVEAARLVKETHPNAIFKLLGFLDVENRTAVPRPLVETWVRDGVIDYLGAADDVRPFISDADCIVLPSYREGTARVLLEGAAMGKALIATDVTGCREPVVPGVNGYLCPVKSGPGLAEAIGTFLALSEEDRLRMGVASRRIAEKNYDERDVIAAYLHALNRVGIGAPS